MTALGFSKTYAGSVANLTVDCRAEFTVNRSGIRASDHAGFWLTNLDTTAANIIWFRLDATVAVAGADDNYVLRPGERCYVRKTDSISFIAAAGTPSLNIAGDQSGIVYS